MSMSFSGVQDQMETIWRAAAPPDPGSLYHFTSLDGATKILKTGRLWATSASAQADGNEGRHLWSLFAVLHGVRGNEGPLPGPESAGALGRWIAQQRLASRRIDMPYILCMTDRRSDLHWSRFGSNGGGVALELDAGLLDKVRKNVRGHRRTASTGGPITYDDDVMRGMLQPLQEALGSAAVEAWDAATAWGDATPSMHHPFVKFTEWSVLLVLFGSFSKCPGFAEETEWRLVIRGPDFDEEAADAEGVSWRTDSGPRRFEIDLPPGCVRRVWLGPETDGKNTNELATILKQRGMPKAEQARWERAPRSAGPSECATCPTPPVARGARPEWPPSTPALGRDRRSGGRGLAGHRRGGG